MRKLLAVGVALVATGALAQEIPPDEAKPAEQPPICLEDPPAQYGYTQSTVPFDPANFQGDLGASLPSVSRCDDCATWVELPFTFEFFGYPYAGAYVSSNGLVSFGGYDAQYSNYAPYVQAKIAAMPAWDDWDTRCGGGVYYRALADRAIVTWDVGHYSCYYNYGRAQFQAVLFADGRIQYNYGSQGVGTDATVALATSDYVTSMGTLIAVPYLYNFNNLDSFLFTPDVDHEPPVTTAAFSGVPGNAPWWLSDVTVTLTAEDLGQHPSGVASTEVQLAGGDWTAYTGPFAVSAEGQTTLCFRSTDARGNQEAAQCTDLFIDKTAPEIVVASPEAGEYLLRQPVTAAWTASDAVSGLASASGTAAPGEAVDTATVGAKTFTVTASDVAGNVATVPVEYFVRYAFGGFLAPIAASGNGLFRLGATIPVKFQLADYLGAPVADATATLALEKVDGTPDGTEFIDAVASGSANTDSLFRYDGAQYVYNLSTKPLSVGTWSLRASLDDGSVRVAPVNLK